MDGEYWFEHDMPNGRLLTISTITNADASEADCDFCDGWGYYLCVWETIEGKREKTILAKMVDEEAARLLHSLLQSTRGQSAHD